MFLANKSATTYTFTHTFFLFNELLNPHSCWLRTCRCTICKYMIFKICLIHHPFWHLYLSTYTDIHFLLTQSFVPLFVSHKFLKKNLSSGVTWLLRKILGTDLFCCAVLTKKAVVVRWIPHLAWRNHLLLIRTVCKSERERLDVHRKETKNGLSESLGKR